MQRGPRPGGIVQSAAPDADYAIFWHAANPGATLGANESGVDTPAIGGALKPTRLYPYQAEPVLGDDDPKENALPVRRWQSWQ